VKMWRATQNVASNTKRGEQHKMWRATQNVASNTKTSPNAHNGHSYSPHLTKIK